MVKALEKNNFLNRDEKIEATHRRDRERVCCFFFIISWSLVTGAPERSKA
jgi:hypothetical protein